MSVKSNKLSGGFEVFSKQGVVGVEVSAMGKTVTLNNNYKPGMISTTLLANGTPLPVSTVVTYVMGSSSCEASFAVNAAKYSLKTTATLMHKGEYNTFIVAFQILEGLAYIPFANGRIEDFIVDLGRVGTQKHDSKTVIFQFMVITS